MKYFLMETDEKNRIPYHINKNHVLDIRWLTREKIDRLPVWNVLEMDFPREGFFPDLICSPCIMMSEIFMKTVFMYERNIVYRAVKLWDKNSGINASYFLPVLEEADCISKETKFCSVGKRIQKLVLSRDKIGNRVVFRAEGMDENCIVGRMDFVESVLRRGIRGIVLKAVYIKYGREIL